MNESLTVVACHNCAHAPLKPAPGLEAMSLVTSDCRPWKETRSLAWCPACGLLQKAVAGDFLEDCRRIYDGYDVYHQAGGREQKVFGSDGVGAARSEHLLRRVLEKCPLQDSGRLLDVGCGNGVLLRSFGQLKPGWRLHGLDLDERSRAEVESLACVEGFSCCDLGEINGRYDLITMLHCLEHVPNPSEFLAKAGDKLTPGGQLLVEVPDYQTNPFDLTIADHCTHFTARSLESTARRAGLEPVFLERGLVSKELTLLARRTEPGRPLAPSEFEDAAPSLCWLKAVLDHARGTVDGNFGVFGTSIAAIWLFSNLGPSIRFFVDEDENRVGRNLFGLPVMRPAEVPADATVYLCLPPAIAEVIRRRLSNGPGRLVAPPQMTFNPTESR